jgi:hypothetical protein
MHPTKKKNYLAGKPQSNPKVSPIYPCSPLVCSPGLIFGRISNLQKKSLNLMGNRG